MIFQYKSNKNIFQISLTLPGLNNVHQLHLHYLLKIKSLIGPLYYSELLIFVYFIVLFLIYNFRKYLDLYRHAQ